MVLTKKTVTHTPLDYFPVKNGQLYIADMPVERAIDIAGQTPAYLYDRKLIQERVSTLKNILPSRILLHYAIKANPMSAVVNHLADRVDGLDVASMGEMHTAINTGMQRSEISFAGPGKNNTELKAAIAAGIVINVESENELLRIENLGKVLAVTPNIAIRVNPDFELKASGMKMSGGPKQFGIDAEKLPAILNNIHNLAVNFEGFHIFSGSQNLNNDALIDAHNKTFALAASLVKHLKLNHTFRFINIGGGFGIPYFPGEEPLDLQPVADNLQRLLDEYTEFNDLQIIIELGRYLVGEAGVYVSRIIDKKVSRGLTYLVTDGGLHHHLSNSGNFGQVIRKNYPVRISTLKPTSKTETVTIVGPLCTPLDTLADKMELPRAEIGDLVIILQSGAYGKSASPENFLGHPHVKELLL